MTSDAGLLEEWRQFRHESRLADLGRGPVRGDLGALRERMADALRPGAIAPLFVAASASGPETTGEPARAALRAVSEAFVERASAAVDGEIAGRVRRQARPEGGYHRALARELDPAERERLGADWDRAESELDDLRHERRRLREDAAVRAGATSLMSFHDAAVAFPAAEVLERFRPAIDALDRDIEIAARLLRLRMGRGRSESARIASLAAHGRAATTASIRGALRRTAELLGADPDLPEVLVVHEPTDDDWADCSVGPFPPVALLPGTLEGPEALARAIGTTVQAVRGVHTRAIPRAWTCDPAFAAAAFALGRRLVLSATFLKRVGFDPDHQGWEELRWATAVVPRRDWAYLELAVAFTRTIATGDEAWRRLERATGLLPTPGELALRFEPPSVAPATLRGIAFALLLEERLLTRHGHGWFEKPAAQRFLREVWDGETHETPESMATALSLGTMDSAPLIERYRP